VWPKRPDLAAPGWRDGAPAIAAGAAWQGGVAAWRAAADVVAEASRWIGAANPTGTRGPWCADFVSFSLRRVGLPPLPNRMASSALAYGPHTSAPRRGDLAVMPHHVGFVEAIEPDGSIELLSGNWGHRVALARLPRAAFVAFVEPAGGGSWRAAGESFHPRARAHAKAKLARFRHAVKRA
jgi:uncharacterized protein (TIGR02594 family)